MPEDYDTRKECIKKWYVYLRKEGKSKEDAQDQALAICLDEFPQEYDDEQDTGPDEY